MAVSSGWWAPILTFGLFAVLELFCGNILEPWLYGKGAGVSPVAVGGGGGFPDMVVGACRTASGDPFDRMPPGDRQTHSPTGLCSFTAVVGELVDLAEGRKPDVVCISAAPPASVLHARHMCRRVRGRFSGSTRGRWIVERTVRSEHGETRTDGGATTHVVATLAEAQRQVRLLIQPLLRPSEETRAAE